MALFHVCLSYQRFRVCIILVIGYLLAFGYIVRMLSGTLKTTARLTFLLLALLLCSTLAFSQSQESDSVSTAFRKGRWLTGLSGGISSSSTKLDTASQRAFGNQYAFDFSTGKFFKDQWLLGGLFKIQRDNSQQFVELESETLLVAPLLSYYLTNNKQGSLFFSIAPGYSRFREKTVIIVAGDPSQEELTGGGFGLFTQLGYSFVLHDRVVFDLGLGLNNNWIRATRKIDGRNNGRKADITIGTVLFSFGFNVILDEFFF